MAVTMAGEVTLVVHPALCETAVRQFCRYFTDCDQQMGQAAFALVGLGGEMEILKNGPRSCPLHRP